MIKFDHLSIPVTDTNRSRDWYVEALGMTIEFEIPERRIIALQDSHGFTIFLHEVSSAVAANGCALWFQVADVDATLPNGRRAVPRLPTHRANPIGTMAQNSPIPTAI